MVLDIHDRKLYEEQVHHVSERLKLATQSAQIGIWDWDVKNNILTWDDQMYALYGIIAGTFSGAYEAWTQGLHPEDNSRAQAELNEALVGGKPFNTEFRVIWPDRSIHYIRAFAIVQQDEAQSAIRMTGVNWDITREKTTEEALIKNIEDLKRSNAELEQFAYVASHDLQEPLRKIRNFSELLELHAGDHIPPETKKYLTPIVNGAMRMQILVRDLLSFSRVSSDDLTVQTVDFQDMTERVIHSLEPVITETQATVKVHTLPTLEANPIQIEQVFQNLIGNGLKYRSKTSPVIEITAKQKERDWEFAIADNGIGLDPQYAERIFVIFQRLHTKQEYAGTGIGLAICKKIIERHGGKIWVESALNMGATFYFTLPIRQ